MLKNYGQANVSQILTIRSSYELRNPFLTVGSCCATFELRLQMHSSIDELNV